MVDGSGGGVLLRSTIDSVTGLQKYASATGAKGQRWMESEVVKTLSKEQYIDKEYYEKNGYGC